MSQYDANAGGMSDFGHSGPKQTNVLGIVGFILAFCTGPIGLIISLIALAKPPRGFAIGGVVVGLISTIVLAFLAFSAWAGGPAIMMSAQTAVQYQTLSTEIASYKTANNGALPPDLASLNLPAESRLDYWGNEWRLEVSADGSTYTLVSASIDGVFGTEDDIRFAEGMGQQELSETLQAPAQRMMEDRFSPDSRGTDEALPSPADAADGTDQ